MKQFRTTIASLPDREHLVAEIFYDGVQWVEISQETDELIIQFYPHPIDKNWEFPLEEALKVLEQTKNRFLGYEKSSE